ncbi:SpaA isopeptide-forming pilin-related protein [Streptococcus sp. ZJ100]|uniref:SpaA isopeptide-forming pilin-related protein n=1 Tax=Streptococcus handemini TaxID=3161188 RepID=UPI0032EC6D15
MTRKRFLSLVSILFLLFPYGEGVVSAIEQEGSPGVEQSAPTPPVDSLLESPVGEGSGVTSPQEENQEPREAAEPVAPTSQESEMAPTSKPDSVPAVQGAIESLDGWWTAITTKRIELGKVSLPVKIGDFEQQSQLEMKEIATDADGSKKVIWYYRSHIVGNDSKTVSQLRNYFSTTTDSGLGAPVITSIQKDGQEVLGDRTIDKENKSLNKSIVEKVTAPENGDYLYTIETPILALRDLYALDIHSVHEASVKKDDVIINGDEIRTAEEKEDVNLISTARVFIQGGGALFDPAGTGLPETHVRSFGSLEEDKLVAGDYTKPNEIRWSASQLNTTRDKQTVTFDLSLDPSQKLKRVKIYTYKPAKNGYQLDNSQVLKDVNLAELRISDLPAGWLAQAEVLAEVTDESVTHSVPNAEIKNAKSDGEQSDFRATNERVERWWETILNDTFDLGSFSIPYKIGDYEQKSNLLKKDIVTNEDGTKKIVWTYRTHISGNSGHVVSNLKTYFSTTTDSGLGTPVITSIRKDGQEIGNTTVTTRITDPLAKSTMENVDNPSDGEYVYTIETPIEAVRDYYALDFHTIQHANLKKGAELSYGGVTTIVDRNKTIDIPSTTRLLLAGSEKLLYPIGTEIDTPFVSSQGSGNHLVAGDYITDTSIRWIGSEVNNSNTPKNITFNLTPDSSQRVRSVKVYQYRPGANGYELANTQELLTSETNIAVPTLPAGWIAQAEVITEVTNEKVNHKVDGAELEGLKTDLTIEKSWLDNATPVATSFTVRLNGQATQVVNMATNERRKVVQNVSKFALAADGSRQRVRHYVDENVPEGYYVAYSGSDEEKLNYFFANRKSTIEDNKPSGNSQCDNYGLTKVVGLARDAAGRNIEKEGIDIDSYTVENAGQKEFCRGGALRMHFKIPGNAKVGDYFDAILPEELIVNHTPDPNNIWTTLNPSGKPDAVSVFHMDKRRIRFVVTKTGANQGSDYTGWFQISGVPLNATAHETTEIAPSFFNGVTTVNGKKRTKEWIKLRRLVLDGILPDVEKFIDPSNPKAATITKELHYGSENHFGSAEDCNKSVRVRTTAHFEKNDGDRVASMFNKYVYEEGPDYITWQILFNLNGENYIWLEDYLIDGIELYHGNNQASVSKDIEVYSAGLGNGKNYNPNDMRKLDVNDRKVMRIEGRTKTGGKNAPWIVNGPDSTFPNHKQYNGKRYNITSHYMLAFKFENPALNKRVLVIRVKTKKTPASAEKTNFIHTGNGILEGGGARKYSYWARKHGIGFSGDLSLVPRQTYNYKFKKLGNANGVTSPLADATFALSKIVHDQNLNRDIESPVGNVTSNAEGIVEFTKLSPNTTYTFQEVSAPTGYTMENAKHTLVVAADGRITIDGQAYNPNQLKEIVNQKIPSASLDIKKTDANTGQLLAGAAFRLQGPNNYNVELGKEIALSQFRFENLAAGDYTLTESRVPSGYTGVGDYHFTVGADGNITQKAGNPATITSTLTNNNLSLNLIVPNSKEPDQYRLKLQKVDANGNGLSNSRFEILNEQKERYNGYVANIDSNGFTFGNAPVKKIVPGLYYLREETAPAGYIKFKEDIPFRILDNGSVWVSPQFEDMVQVTRMTGNDSDTFWIKIKNEKPKISLKKVSATDENQVLSGAAYTLYQSDGRTEVATQTTDDSGLITFENLALNTTYKLKEKTAPAGYLLNETMYELRVSTDGTITLTNADKLLQVDSARTGYLAVIAKDQPVPKYRLKIVKVNESDEKITDNKTRFTFRQTKDPNSPVIDGQTATLTQEGGGVFLFDNRGNKFGSGVYYIHEEISPTGYVALPEPIELTISERGEFSVQKAYKDIVRLTKEEGTDVIEIKVKNFKPGEFPHTGGIGMGIFIVTGLSLMVISGFFLMMRQKPSRARRRRA